MGRPIQLKFLFANRDGLVVEVGCELQTPVVEVKAALLAQWPTAAGETPDVGRIRLICMGLGILADGKTLEQCRVPLFPTHPTPINVSVRETYERASRRATAAAARGPPPRGSFGAALKTAPN
jgi:hypothetical protein